VTALREQDVVADDGPEGNSRITAANGLVLLVLLAVEGVTVLDVRGMLTLHIVLGVILIPPVLLKSATTFWRFAKYYRGAEPYVRKGPPHIILRVLGPIVLLSSLALLGTGLVLVLSNPKHDSAWLTLHQASFIVWVAVMTIHVLGHTLEAVRISRDEFRRDKFRRGRAVRLAAIALVLVAGVGTAAAVWPTAKTWATDHDFSNFGKFNGGDH
jgi:hypothetical protein